MLPGVAVAHDSYTANGSANSFAFTFPVRDKTGILVYAGTTLQQLDVDYRVDFNGAPTPTDPPATGRVICVAGGVDTPPANLTRISILPAAAAEQTTDYTLAAFDGEQVEDDLDSVAMICRRLDEQLGRALALDPYSTYRNPALPDPEIGKSLEWESTTPPRLRNVTPGATGVSLPLSKANGGWGRSIASDTGIPYLKSGNLFYLTGIATPEQFGAVGDGVTDDSAAIQAAIDSDAQSVWFDPDKTYKVSTPVVIDAINSANTSDSSRDINGMGCHILGDGGAYAFRVIDAAWPNMQLHLKFHGFRFTGTVTTDWIRHETARSWYCEYYDLRAAQDAYALSLLHLQNVSTVSQPGMFRLIDLKSSCKATVRFSRASAGILSQFDDFYLSGICGGGWTGATVPDDSGAVVIETGCVLVHADINNVISGGQHGILAYGAYLQKCRISRVYVEIPPKEKYTGSNKSENWAIAGELDWCHIDTVAIFFPNRTDNPGCRCVYAIANDCQLLNVSMHVNHLSSAGSPGGMPYTVVYYPAIEILGGERNTWDFDYRYVQNGANIPGRNTYLGGTRVRIENVDNTLATGWTKDVIITNYGQGAPATITLPAAVPGMDLRFVMSAAGQTYHVKPAAGNKIRLNGTMLHDGDKVSNASTAVGDAIHLYTFLSGYTSGTEYDYDWICVSEAGSWSDGGA